MREVVVPAPVREGQVVARDVLATGVDMLASRPVGSEPE
jgi:CxxC motif-containing protein